MNKKLGFLVLLPLAMVSMGQQQVDCNPPPPPEPNRVISEDGRVDTLAVSHNDAVVWVNENQQHKATLYLTPEARASHNRIEVFTHPFGPIGMLSDLRFWDEQEIDDLPALQRNYINERYRDMFLGSWASWSSDEGPILDLMDETKHPAGFNYSELHVTDMICQYHEGICNLTLPWQVENLDPFIEWFAPEVAEALGPGLGALLGEGLDKGLADMTGVREEEDKFWFADFQAGIRRDTVLPTQVLVDYRLDQWDRPDHQVCFRTYLRFDGRLDWTPYEGFAETAQYIFGFGWVLNLFGILECPPDHLTAVTVCGQFGVSTGDGTDTMQGYKRQPFGTVWVPDKEIPVPAGQPVFRHGEVWASISPWRPVRIGCNNNRGTMEVAVRDIVAETIDFSFNTMITKAFAGFDLSFNDAFLTAEGLTLRIADNEYDPNYAAANAMGLCRDRQPESGRLHDIAYTGTPFVPGPPVPFDPDDWDWPW